MTEKEKQNDSGSDSSWFVQDTGETIEEADAKWVTGDGIKDEDTDVEDPEKPTNSETGWINAGSEANSDDAESVKGHGVRFVKVDGLETPAEDTVEIDEEENVKQDLTLINW